MTIALDHTIVPAKNNEESARFFARIFGLTYDGPFYHFAPVKVNDTLTLDFDTDIDFKHQHYAFKVSAKEFDEIFGRVKAEKLPYGGGPMTPDDGKLYDRDGTKGFYFRDLDGHLLEVLTR